MKQVRNPQQKRDKALYHQVYHLPRQLARARARVRQLEAQALRMGLSDLIEHTESPS